MTLVFSIFASAAISIAIGNYLDIFQWKQLLGTLFGLQDIPSLKPGVITSPYLGNSPLWSLSYEIFFYAIFPVALLGKMNIEARTTIIGTICVACYLGYMLHPSHFLLVGSYFLIWWAGAFAAHMYSLGKTRIIHISLPIFWLLCLTLIAAGNTVLTGFAGLGVYPFLMVRHFLVAALILISFYSPIGKWISHRIKDRTGIIRFTASISYGIYIFHYPILITSPFSYSPLGFMVALAVLVLCSYAFDRRLNRFLAKIQQKYLAPKLATKGLR